MMFEYAKRVWPFILLILSVILVLYPINGFNFQLEWDDQWQIVNHYTTRGFTWSNLKAVFSTYYYGQYSPVNELIYTLIYSLWGYYPLAYHLYPLILHIINACLVFFLVEQFVKRRIAETTGRWIAFVTALLFAVHPLQVESITWISASKIPLYTFFVLLAFLTYFRYVQTQKVIYYVGTLLLFVCSFGSKEQSIVLPATLFLLDWIIGRTPIKCCENMLQSEQKPEIKPWAYLIVEKMPFIVFAFFGAMCTLAQQGSGSADYSFGQRIVFGCYSIVEYFGKLAIPVNLLYLYPFPMAPGLPMPAKYYVYPVIVICAAAILIYALRHKHWPIIFGLLFFFINIGLMLHIIEMSRWAVIADRYVYLPCVGFFFIAAWYGVPWLQQIMASGRKWVIALPIAYVLYLGGYAHYRTYVWKDSDTLKKELQDLVSPTVQEMMKEKGEKASADSLKQTIDSTTLKNEIKNHE